MIFGLKALICKKRAEFGLRFFDSTIFVHTLVLLPETTPMLHSFLSLFFILFKLCLFQLNLSPLKSPKKHNCSFVEEDVFD